MKKKLLSLVIVAAFASNAYASNEQEVALLPSIVASAQTQAVDVTPALNALDMQAAFQQDKQPIQMAALSGQEMKATQGAFGWFAVMIAVSWINTYWGATSTSQQDQAVSFALSRGFNYATCGNPILCNPFRANGSWR